MRSRATHRDVVRCKPGSLGNPVSESGSYRIRRDSRRCGRVAIHRVDVPDAFSVDAGSGDARSIRDSIAADPVVARVFESCRRRQPIPAPRSPRSSRPRRSRRPRPEAGAPRAIRLAARAGAAAFIAVARALVAVATARTHSRLRLPGAFAATLSIETMMRRNPDGGGTPGESHGGGGGQRTRQRSRWVSR